MVGGYCPNKFPCNILLSQIELSSLHRGLHIFRIRTIVHCVANLSWFWNQASYLMTHFMMKNSYQIMFPVNIIPFGLIHVHIKKNGVRGEIWRHNHDKFHIPWIRYMVVWIQNHDKFVVLIWKTLDMGFGCKIRINSLHSVQYSNTKNIGSIKFPIWILLTRYFSISEQLYTV